MAESEENVLYWTHTRPEEAWKFYADGIAVRRLNTGVIEIKTETHDEWVEVR